MKSLNKKQIQYLKDFALFAILLFSFHYIYIFWSKCSFYPFSRLVDSMFEYFSVLVTKQSDSIIHWVFNLPHTTVGIQIEIPTRQGEFFVLEVSPGCTTLKQWLHWVFLMVLFPGNWKHKLWYIPLGLVVIHIVNLIRITGLSIAMSYYPTKFEFFHNYIFKTLFYAVIFAMWVIWNEKIRKKTKLSSK